MSMTTDPHSTSKKPRPREEARQHLKHLANRIRDSIAGEEQGQRWLHDAAIAAQPTREVMFVTDEAVYSLRLFGGHHLDTAVGPLSADAASSTNAVVASAAYASKFLEGASRAFEKHAAANDCAPVPTARIELEDLGMSSAPGSEQDQPASGQCPAVDEVAGAVRPPIEIAEVSS